MGSGRAPNFGRPRPPSPGALGSKLAEVLHAIGYPVSIWTRSPRQDPRFACFAGAEALPAFAADLSVLVCLLPLTPDTQGIVNADLLSRLPRGAFFVNAGRGQEHVEADLLAALDDGQVRRRVLGPPRHVEDLRSCVCWRERMLGKGVGSAMRSRGEHARLGLRVGGAAPVRARETLGPPHPASRMSMRSSRGGPVTRTRHALTHAAGRDRAGRV